MAEWGTLAQVLPAATTLTTAYTCLALERGTVSVMICNRAGAAIVRLSIGKNGAADASAQALLYDYPLSANDAITTARFTLAAGDVVRVRSDTGSVAFTVNGIMEGA